MTNHQLQKIESGWRCATCSQAWKSKPRTECPGVPVYNWENRPKDTTSLADLEIQNRKPTSSPVGVIGSGKSNWVYLYERGQTELIDPDLPKTYTWNNRPKELKTANQLQRFNITPGKAKPKGQCPSSSGWIYLYDPTDEGFSILDPTLPHCYRSKDDVPDNLKSKRDLKSINLIPGNATPKGCYRFWGKEEEEWVTILLYHAKDCQWEAADQYICKSTLRQTYLLSDRWIKQLGTPDLIQENPHHKKFAPMHLYSRQRVEQFLAEHAEEYARWLSDRNRYVAIFEQNREAIQAGLANSREAQKREKILEQGRRHAEREAERFTSRLESGDFWAELKAKDQAIAPRREQMIRCLKCASGCATPQGFLCAIFPKGLEDHQIPCLEWSQRSV